MGRYFILVPHTLLLCSKSPEVRLIASLGTPIFFQANITYIHHLHLYIAVFHLSILKFSCKNKDWVMVQQYSVLGPSWKQMHIYQGHFRIYNHNIFLSFIMFEWFHNLKQWEVKIITLNKPALELKTWPVIQFKALHNHTRSLSAPHVMSPHPKAGIHQSMSCKLLESSDWLELQPVY